MKRPARTAAPWTDADVAVLGTLPDAAAARKLGRSLTAVVKKRLSLDIPAHSPRARAWTRQELRLLGTMSDAALAARLGVARKTILETRQRLGVAAFSPHNRPRRLG